MTDEAFARELLNTPGLPDGSGNMWPPSEALAAAQAYALLYVGDQVKALVELHREAVAQGARVAGDLVPQLARLLEQVLMPQRIVVNDELIDDAEAARLRERWIKDGGPVKLLPPPVSWAPATVDVDPTAQHMPTAQFARELLERDQERRESTHPGPRCVCDPICRAITEATR